MFGAVIGDLIGSPYIKNEKTFDGVDSTLLSDEVKATEITVMTLAVAEALMQSMPMYGIICDGGIFQKNLIYRMKKFGQKFTHIRYGRKFYAWLHVKKSFPYESKSNGAALRVSPIAWAFNNLEDVERFAELAACVTTKTDESINFARVMAGMIFLARMKKDKDEIKNYFQERSESSLSTFKEFDIKFNFLNIEGMRPKCCDSISAALACFLEGKKFDDSVSNAISLGGKTNETASMAGALTEAYSGVKILTEVEAFEKLNGRLQFTIEKWEQWKN